MNESYKRYFISSAYKTYSLRINYNVASKFKVTLRETRGYLKIFTDLQIKYQHRLTRYLLNYYRASLLLYIKSYALNLKTLLNKVFIFFTPTEITNLITLKLIYLNGYVTSNKDLSIYKFDVIQLLYN